MEKVYTPQSFEKKIYKMWEDSGAFKASSKSKKKPFTIMMPPPNITGQLHIGHALDNTLQDLLIRFKRMKGFEALWQPGTDHASIATEVKILERLRKEGITKENLTREDFLTHAYKWKEEFGGRIIEQFRYMGNSCDWDRLAFTMDAPRSEAVLKFFSHLYSEGLIYKGSRIINWCVSCKTALSDAEVEYEAAEGNLWHIKYPIKGGGQSNDSTPTYITIATTRPETMLGDTAVCVNPSDKRYKHLIGKTLILPLTGREINIIKDDYVDPAFGTGAVKITPAHDPNDFEIGERHNLPTIRVMNDDGTMNAAAGKDFEGLDRFAARKKVVEMLKTQGLLEKIEPHQLNRGECYRCNSVVEPIVSEQWFVKMQSLATAAIEAVKSEKINFVPKYFEKTYFNWMNNIKDWCISRQLWWGHRIPAYYCDACGETVVSAAMPTVCPKCGGKKFTQDPDVLDTWFSSGLWTFATLINDSDDFKFFHPTDVLVTGYELIFFWIARMIMSSLFETGEIPFKDVLIHGMVRDKEGRKMSKSLGNGVDPIEIIDKFGADSLRFSLLQGITNGADIRFSEEKVEAARNFCNKLWNASRYVLMNVGDEFSLPHENELVKNGNTADRWILHKFNETVESVTVNIEKYEFGNAAVTLYDFVWSDFCDWYIELSKTILYGEDNVQKNHTLNVLLFVLKGILKLLHPFIPFITEEIWSQMPNNDSLLIVSDYPECDDRLFDKNADAAANEIMETIKEVRALRLTYDVPNSKRIELFAEVNMTEGRLGVFKAFVEKLANCTLNLGRCGSEKTAMFITSAGKFLVSLGELVDTEKERARLTKEIESTKNELKRAEQLLSNPSFTAKAPPALIEKEREKTQKFVNIIKELEAKLKEL